MTVLIPAYRHERFIEAALASVVSQTQPCSAILVVDDCSPDRTVECARRIADSRVRIEVNPRNLGLGPTVVRALDWVQTPYLALLNSDDVFHRERLERCLDVLRASTAAQVVATEVVPIDSAQCRVSKATVSPAVDGQDIVDWMSWFDDHRRRAAETNLLASLLERNFLVSSSNIVCRTPFLKRRTATLSRLKYCLDWYIFLEAAGEGALSVVSDELLGYRLHAGNTVWFSSATRADYTREVNDVLVSTLTGLLNGKGTAGLNDPATVIELTRMHAARHSEASRRALLRLQLHAHWIRLQRWIGERTAGG